MLVLVVVLGFCHQRGMIFPQLFCSVGILAKRDASPTRGTRMLQYVQ